ncbi:MAG: hypothetical protein ACXIVQ_05240 [Acidimicrobiales bacterium]
MSTNSNSRTNSVARTLNDLGLAVWFGGSLMGAIGLNAAARTTDAPARTADVGWSRWSLVNGAAIGAYAVGSLVVTKENKGRIAVQSGVASTALVNAGLTGCAIAATAYARVLGRRVTAGEASDDGARASEEQRGAERRLAVLQWAVPVLTGAMIVSDSRLSEQQRPAEVLHGVLQRLNPAA